MVFKCKNKNWDNEPFIQNTKHHYLPLYIRIAYERIAEQTRKANQALRDDTGFPLVFSEREIRLFDHSKTENSAHQQLPLDKSKSERSWEKTRQLKALATLAKNLQGGSQQSVTPILSDLMPLI